MTMSMQSPQPRMTSFTHWQAEFFLAVRDKWGGSRLCMLADEFMQSLTMVVVQL